MEAASEAKDDIKLRNPPSPIFCCFLNTLVLVDCRGRSDIESKLITVPFPRMIEGAFLKGGSVGRLGGGEGNVIGVAVDWYVSKLGNFSLFIRALYTVSLL